MGEMRNEYKMLVGKPEGKIPLRIATGWRAGRPEFDSRQELGFFLFATASIPALGPTQPPS